MTPAQKAQAIAAARKKREGYEQECRDFRMCFANPAGNRVLFYLANFCSAALTCVYIPHEGGPIDRDRTLINEGRREVFLEIQKRLSLTPEQLVSIATGGMFTGAENDE